MATVTYDDMTASFDNRFASTSKYSLTDYLEAYTEAVKDTGFSYPNDSSYQQIWLKKRILRHLYDLSLSRCMDNFDVPKAKLEQMYKHYEKQIEKLDSEFYDEKANNPEEYGLDAGSQFGMTASTGFLHDPLTGRDLTYTEDNEDGILINGKSAEDVS